MNQIWLQPDLMNLSKYPHFITLFILIYLLQLFIIVAVVSYADISRNSSNVSSLNFKFPSFPICLIKKSNNRFAKYLFMVHGSYQWVLKF